MRQRKSSFAPEAARFSWICSVVGFFAVIFAGASHIRPVIILTVALVLLGMLVSLACGIYALFCVREQGKQGILLPALIGVGVSGFFVLFVISALIAGLVEGMNEPNPFHKTMNQAVPAQTNASPTLQQ